MLTNVKPIGDARLQYYKCLECLSAYTTKQTRLDECACGSQNIEHMGAVRRQSYVRIEELTPCDDRCTNAQGPQCNCACGGEHHGTGRLIETVTVLGRVVVAKVDQAALDRAREFRDAMRAAKDRLTATHGPTLDKIARREYITDSGLYWSAVKASKAYKAFYKAKVHKTRMREINAFCLEAKAA